MQELVVHLINLHPKLLTNITPTRSLFINNCDLHMQLTGGLLVPRGLNVNVYIHIHVYILYVHNGYILLTSDPVLFIIGVNSYLDLSNFIPLT